VLACYRRVNKQPKVNKRAAASKRSLFPATLDVTLKYCDVIRVAVAAATTAHQAFRANSIFDPDLTGTGHQPLGRDQLAAMYSEYEVLSSRLRVRVCDRLYTGDSLTAVAWCDDDGTTTGPISQCMEQPTAQWAASSMYQPTFMEVGASFSEARDFGPGSHEVSDMGGNPSRQMYLNVALQCATATSAELACEVEYRVRFSSPIEISQS